MIVALQLGTHVEGGIAIVAFAVLAAVAFAIRFSVTRPAIALGTAVSALLMALGKGTVAVETDSFLIAMAALGLGWALIWTVSRRRIDDLAMRRPS